MGDRTRNYQFRYQQGQSMPHNTFTAIDDADFYRKLRQFEQGAGVKLAPGTIKCTVTETYTLPDPPPDGVLAQKAKIPEWNELGRKGRAQ